MIPLIECSSESNGLDLGLLCLFGDHRYAMIGGARLRGSDRIRTRTRTKGREKGRQASSQQHKGVRRNLWRCDWLATGAAASICRTVCWMGPAARDKVWLNVFSLPFIGPNGEVTADAEEEGR